MSIAILGDGQHAGVLAETIRLTGGDPYMVSKHGKPGATCRLIVGVGAALDRRRLFLEYSWDRFVNVIHPTAFVSPSAKLGAGVHIEAFAYIGPNVTLEDNVLVNTGAHISHDTRIGKHTVIAPGVIVCGDCRIGEACAIGAGTVIIQRVGLPAETQVPAGCLVVSKDDIRKSARKIEGAE